MEMAWNRVISRKETTATVQKKRDVFMQRLVDEHKQHKNTDEEHHQNQKTMIEVLLSLQQTEPEYYTDMIIKNLMLVSS